MSEIIWDREEAISMKKPIAIGIEDYKEMIDKGYYYIDKTLFLRELLDKGGKVNLFTRPRRFGKTLALSMVKTFFEIDLESSVVRQDHKHYFQGMKILQEGEKYTQHIGKYPVVSISLKSAKQPEFKMAYISLQDEIVREYERHSYVLEGDILLASNQDKYRSIMEGKAEYVTYAKSLYFLMSCLKKFHKKNVILLIDEYDVPLENAYLRGFYGRMADFTVFYRAIFEGDSGKMEQIIKKHLMESISYYDSVEAFYHGFLLGLLGPLQDCEVASNQESGDGRPDIMLKPYDDQQFAIILELKRASRYTQMEGLCEVALTQIVEKNYQAELLEEGYTKIRSYGICFCKKSCMVKMA